MHLLNMTKLACSLQIYYNLGAFSANLVNSFNLNLTTCVKMGLVSGNLKYLIV